MRSQLILKRSTMHSAKSTFSFFPAANCLIQVLMTEKSLALGRRVALVTGIDWSRCWMYTTFHLTWCVFGSILDVVVVIQDGVVQVVVIVVVNVVVHVVVAGWRTALSRPPYQRPSPSPSPSWSPSCAGNFRCKPGLIIHDVVVILTKVNCQLFQVLAQHWRCWCDPLHSG